MLLLLIVSQAIKPTTNKESPPPSPSVSLSHLSQEKIIKSSCESSLTSDFGFDFLSALLFELLWFYDPSSGFPNGGNDEAPTLSLNLRQNPQRARGQEQERPIEGRRYSAGQSRRGYRSIKVHCHQTQQDSESGG